MLKLLLQLLILLWEVSSSLRFIQLFSSNVKSGSSTSVASDFLDLGKPYLVDPNNPPFFPRSVEDLAKDASFSIKVALVSQLTRIRVDVRLRLTSRNKAMMEWLILLGC